MLGAAGTGGCRGSGDQLRLAARIGQVMEPVLRPVGFDWQIDVALVPRMAVREVAVPALGTVYTIESVADNPAELGRTLTAHWNLATALALLAWHVFTPQCASTLAVVRRETNSWKWTAFLFSHMLGLGYLAAFVTYHMAVWLGAGQGSSDNTCAAAPCCHVNRVAFQKTVKLTTKPIFLTINSVENLTFHR